jgi:solute:Na+ symporter, SSS family
MLIDLSILAAFVLFSVAAGFAARRRASQSLEEYFLAGRQESAWRAGFSMAATQFAADTPLLVTGLLAASGIYALWRLWIYALAFLLMGFVLGAPWRRARVLTDAELTMRRYSARGALALRALKAVYYGTIINSVVLAFVLAAATRLFELFVPWHAWLPSGIFEPLRALVAASGIEVTSGLAPLDVATATADNLLSILLMLAFVSLYSMTGGLRAVISTDVLQLALMLGGTAVYAWFAVGAAGGLAALPQHVTAIYGDAATRLLSFVPPPGEALLPFAVIIGLQWLYQVNADGTGYLAQRTMACANAREARRAAVVFTVTQIVVRSLLWLLIGVALLVIYPFDPARPVTDGFIAGRELTFATGIDRVLPAGARGVMLTGMLAALASTVDTHLNWGASYWANDLYKPLWVERIRGREARPGELVRVARWANIALISIALVVMANLGSIQQGWQLSLLFGSGVGAVLVLRWLWERVNLYCELGAIAVSLLLAPLLLVTVDADWLRLALMASVSTAVVIAAAIWLPGTDDETLAAFYDRVRPPGWWPRAAALVNAERSAAPRALGRGIKAVIACAVSVFACLVGLAQLLLQTTSPATALALVAIGIAAVPVWWRSVESEQ